MVTGGATDELVGGTFRTGDGRRGLAMLAQADPSTDTLVDLGLTG